MKSVYGPVALTIHLARMLNSWPTIKHNDQLNTKKPLQTTYDHNNINNNNNNTESRGHFQGIHLGGGKGACDSKSLPPPCQLHVVRLWSACTVDDRVSTV